MNIDLDRTVDPMVQGECLSHLHKATIESENCGRNFLRVLEAEVDPAIKELSSCLLYPDSSASELDQCLQKFEAAISSLRLAQRTLQGCMDKVRTASDKLFK